jgi:fatty acid synthase subunit alpha
MDIGQVAPESTLKQLSGGKSAVLNEIAGELEQELGSIPSNAAELPLQEVAGAAKSYSPPGPAVKSLINKSLAAKLPGGMAQSRLWPFIQQTLGFDMPTAQAVCLHAIVTSSKARLASEQEVKEWMQTAATGFQTVFKVQLSAPSTTSSGAARSSAPRAARSAASRAPAVVLDEPITALQAIRTICALKLGMSFQQAAPTATLKSLTAGKSAVMNEIAGEVEKELGALPDGASDLTLTEIADKTKAYNPPGKVCSALISKHLQNRLPGGFSASHVRKVASTLFAVGPRRVESILLHACVHDASVKSTGRLSNEADVNAWLTATVQQHAADLGLAVPSPPSAAASGGEDGEGEEGEVVVYRESSESMQLLIQKLLRLAGDMREGSERFMGVDSHAPLRDVEEMSAKLQEATKALDLWRSEHGTQYERGIRPVFNSNKQRVFTSWWAWGVQAALELAHRHIIPSVITTRSNPGNPFALSRKQVRSLGSRISPQMERILKGVDKSLASVAGGIQSGAEVLSPKTAAAPKFVSIFTPQGPSTVISKSGVITCVHEPRVAGGTSRSYVVDVAGSAANTFLADIISVDKPIATSELEDGAQGPIVFVRDPHSHSSEERVDIPSTRELFKALMDVTCPLDPHMQLSVQDRISTKLSEGQSYGVTFTGKTALVVGCGPGSIGLEILKGLLEGGACVIATTSRYSEASVHALQQVYQACGAQGSSLYVLPFNAGSVADVDAILAHIYNNLHLDIDFFCPFGAVSEIGDTTETLGGKNEFAHRCMMTNVVRMVGAIAGWKRRLQVYTRPCMVILPLSPNHGLFGSDGLYSESKLGLEALINKASSESWGEYILICGAVIGWTRGTGLMSGNDIVAEGVEALGCRTFAQEEMALNIMSLLTPRIVRLATRRAIVADFTGGFSRISNLKDETAKIRASLQQQAETARNANKYTEHAKTETIVSGFQGNLVEFPPLPSEDVRRRMSPLPTINKSSLHGMVDLDSVVVVTGYGEVCPWGNARTRWDMEASGELSVEGCVLLAWMTGKIRYASHREDVATPHAMWEDASTGELVSSFDVKSRYEEELLRHSGVRLIEPTATNAYDPAKKLFLHSIALDKDLDWIEVPSLVEVEEFRRQLGSEFVDVRMLPRQTAASSFSTGTAARDYAGLESHGSDMLVQMRIRKGAVISVPKALRFDRFVAGQLPAGWDPIRFGIPSDLASRIDPVVSYSLVAVAEALLSSGICDAYELYKYIHVSELGLSVGGGMGGMSALKNIFNKRFQEGDMPSDVLQETFINTTSAWISMLMLSGSGPIKTPVGACATAAESIDIAVDTIMSGKAQVMIVGGVDDFCEEGSYEFAKMGATSNSAHETEHGREPRTMSRPMTTTRGGFMESQGAGVQVLMTARLAITMGAPIYGIVACSNTAMDKLSRSVPAPGQGILTTARASKSKGLPSLFSTIAARRLKRDAELKELDSWKQDMLSALPPSKAREDTSLLQSELQVSLQHEQIMAEYHRMKASIVKRWFCGWTEGSSGMSPLEVSLNTWGASVEDITVASFHGTGTKANDVNESEVTQLQLASLGRSTSNPVLAVCQKHLTGHPKGAAAAWMVNGALQMINSGIVPGNRNLDDLDAYLQKFDLIAHINRTLHLGPGAVRGVILKSFGFGQASAEILLLHPNFLLSALSEDVFSTYAAARDNRFRSAHEVSQAVLRGSKKMVSIKTTPPYSDTQIQKVYLDSEARVKFDPALESYRFFDEDLITDDVKPDSVKASAFFSSCLHVTGIPSGHSQVSPIAIQASDPATNGIAATIGSLAAQLGAEAKGAVTGVDVEDISVFTSVSDAFLERNFTAAEIQYCKRQPNVAASLCGTWCAKEAALKALCIAFPSLFLAADATSPLKDIVVDRLLAADSKQSAPPAIHLSGALQDMVQSALFNSATTSARITLNASISHTSTVAVAVALLQTHLNC